MSYRRKQQDKHRLEHLYNQTKYSYGSGAFWDSSKGRLVKWNMSNGHRNKTNGHSGRTKYLKNQSNRKLRRSCKLYNNGSYKKLFDYWWTLF